MKYFTADHAHSTASKWLEEQGSLARSMEMIEKAASAGQFKVFMDLSFRDDVLENILTGMGYQVEFQEGSDPGITIYWIHMPCFKCGGNMKEGKAIPPAIGKLDERERTEVVWTGIAPRISVWKCELCGHSFTK